MVYFYLRDFIGGCMIEVWGFESFYNDFFQVGVEVIGISVDSVDDYEFFCESEGLSFFLLFDFDGIVSKVYGLWMVLYLLCYIFLIDLDGVLCECWVVV